MKMNLKTTQLFNSQNQVLVEKLAIAHSFLARGWGLLGHESLGEGEGMWISPCWNIHTHFMRFAIDCVFIDSKLKVLATFADVCPWRMVAKPGAGSVIELAAGEIKRRGIQIGDDLHVGT